MIKATRSELQLCPAFAFLQIPLTLLSTLLTEVTGGDPEEVHDNMVVSVKAAEMCHQNMSRFAKCILKSVPTCIHLHRR